MNSYRYRVDPNYFQLLFKKAINPVYSSLVLDGSGTMDGNYSGYPPL
jgi:hypothetical protein